MWQFHGKVVSMWQFHGKVVSMWQFRGKVVSMWQFQSCPKVKFLVCGSPLQSCYYVSRYLFKREVLT